MKIFVAHYHHKHGDEVSAYWTPEEAEPARQDIAAEWWETECLANPGGFDGPTGAE